MRYVIVGASYAAVGAVEEIRSIDSDGEILIVSDEPYRIYARPLISYYLENRVAEKNMYFRPEEFYEKNRLKFVSGKKVVKVEPDGQKITLDDKSVIDYDRLLICTGGKPFIPPLKGIYSKNVFSFVKWDDAKKIKKLADGAKEVLIVGGGLIGLKAAEGLGGLGLKVTIIEKEASVLPLVLDETAGKILREHLKDNGVDMVTGNVASEILADESGCVTGVALDNGDSHKCGLLIIAIGVRPNIDLIEGTAIEVNRGIVVDRRMRTNVDNIYSAGDVVEAWDILSGSNSVIAIAPLAFEQGKVAGCNMAGGKSAYTGGIAMNSTDVFNMSLMTMGLTKNLDESYEIKSYKDGEVYKKLVFKDDMLKGVILVGDVDYGGALTQLIRNQADIKDIKDDLANKVLGKAGLASILPTILSKTPVPTFH
ncbi:MAG TPA: NAD(P)/FAD-dependent oxidoreductase [Nitrospirae bacterium]|nr:NAD(P)/FAD-dependent oxidoreductase [Nitrospirota bacterium]